MRTCVATDVDYASQGREDPELRALIHAAETGLTATRTPVFKTPRRAEGTASSRLFVIFAAIVAVPAIALPLRLSLASADPVVAKGIWDAAAFVESDARRSEGRFLLATVKKTPGTKANTAAAMRQSQRNAIAAAKSCTGARGVGDIRVRSRGVTGPSAGLMLGLTVMDRLLERDLTRGMQVAGTGQLSAGGRVDPVGAVAQKAAAARQADADLFFVPLKQVAEAKRAGASLRVVGVRHLDDAVRVLTGSGCRR